MSGVVTAAGQGSAMLNGYNGHHVTNGGLHATLKQEPDQDDPSSTANTVNSKDESQPEVDIN